MSSELEEIHTFIHNIYTRMEKILETFCERNLETPDSSDCSNTLEVEFESRTSAVADMEIKTRPSQQGTDKLVF